MLRTRWLGEVKFREALNLQRQLFTASGDDHLLLLEHEHVFTGGRNADPNNLLIDPASVGASYEIVDRGGDITYHGPGQITGYPVISLKGRRGGGIAETRAYVHELEAVLINALSDIGLRNCGRLPKYPGVWVNPESDNPKKIAAVGVRLSRGRTMHGFALNVNTDMTWFDHIIPCGIAGLGTTSIEFQGLEVSTESVAQTIGCHAAATWGAHGAEFASGTSSSLQKSLEDFASKETGEPDSKQEVSVFLRDRKPTPRRERRLKDAGLGEGLPITEKKPSWMKARIDLSAGYKKVRSTIADLELTTVCEEAGCPNIYECWGEGTATFMINGSRCTRSCGFCLVDTRRPQPLDPDEPRRVAEAAAAMGLQHVVITAVARDDLEDGGANGFAQTIKAIREKGQVVNIETLVPDFSGLQAPLETQIDPKPDVINHNLETVARLQRMVRPNAGYARSLALLARSKQNDFLTKSGLIVGLGETDDELYGAIGDLAGVGVDILTIGQYLRPSSQHLPIQRWVPPTTFNALAEYAKKQGIGHVEASPLTRSSHKAATAIRSLPSAS